MQNTKNKTLIRKIRVLKDNRDSMLKSLNHTLNELFKAEEEFEKLNNEKSDRKTNIIR